MLPIDLSERYFSQDPKEPEFYHNPYRLYEKLHEIGGPVFWQDYGFWCLAEFDAVSAALRDDRFARLPPADKPKPAYQSHLDDFALVERHSLLALEPPQHTRIRRSVNKAFVNRRVQEMEANIALLANQLIDQFENKTQIDLLTEYATPIPVTVIARLLGVPENHTSDLLRWSHAMVKVYTLTQSVEDEIEANRAAAQFNELLLSLIADRRDSPQNDLLSHMVQLQEEPLSDEEIVSTAVLLLNAGHEATVHQIGNAIKTLLELNEPGTWIDDIDKGDKVVAEALRYDPPLHLFTRYAQETVDLHTGVRIEKGEQIALLLGAANRDPRKFTAAATFMPERNDAATVAFGGGLHFCIGTALAKLEIRIALNTLFKRLPHMKLVQSPSYQNSFHFHGLEKVMVQIGSG